MAQQYPQEDPSRPSAPPPRKRSGVISVVLALILGPIGEKGLRNALRASQGDVKVLFSSVVCWVLIGLCVLGIASPFLMAKLEKKSQEEANIPDEEQDIEPADIE